MANSKWHLFRHGTPYKNLTALRRGDVHTIHVIQEIMNEPMRRLRASANDLIQHGVALHEELREILDGGLVVIDECVYFSTELAISGHLSLKKKGALGHQSLINKLHLDFYVEDEQPEKWDSWCVAQGVLLAYAVLSEAEKITNLPIDVVITLDEGGAQPPTPTTPWSALAKTPAIPQFHPRHFVFTFIVTATPGSRTTNSTK